MFTRVAPLPSRSTFVFGPRSTGKSTWLKSALPGAHYIDLLQNKQLHRLLVDPGALRSEVLALPKNAWVILDEIQRVPALLNEVHALIEETRHRFVLSGSSARKLKRGGGNLLAGRASVLDFFPLTFAEFGGAARIGDVLRFGTLPIVLDEPSARIPILEAYAGIYLREEIKEEALTRNVDSFARFLEIAALANGQVTNLASIARDAGVARATVTTYFEILEDTLIGFRLPAWRPRLRVKEQGHPKFYLFDTGVARVLQRRLHDAPSSEELGHLFETYVLHELRAHRSYHGIGGELSHWRTQDGVEVDFVWTRGKRCVAIEAKSSSVWKPEFDRAISALRDATRLSGAFGVYLGERELVRPWGRVLPIARFCEWLAQGRILE